MALKGFYENINRFGGDAARILNRFGRFSGASFAGMGKSSGVCLGSVCEVLCGILRARERTAAPLGVFGNV